MKNKGITLVALVITIIILLILAGITISQLTGSGLFENARLAEEKYKNAQEKENSILDDYENKIEKYISPTKTEVNSIEDILDVCDINGNYTKEQIINNEDDVLSVIFENGVSTNFLLENNLQDICNSQEAMIALGESEYAGYEVIMNDEYFDEVMSSTYVDDFDAGSITTPTMTSDVLEGRAALSTESLLGYPYWSNEDAYYSFDKNSSTISSVSADGTGAVAFDFGENMIAYKIKIIPGGDGNSSNLSGFIGYSDIENNIELTSVLEYTNSNINNYNVYTLNEKSAHRIWGIANMKRWDGVVSGYPYGIGVAELEIYCRKPQ